MKHLKKYKIFENVSYLPSILDDIKTLFSDVADDYELEQKEECVESNQYNIYYHNGRYKGANGELIVEDPSICIDILVGSVPHSAEWFKLSIVDSVFNFMKRIDMSFETKSYLTFYNSRRITKENQINGLKKKIREWGGDEYLQIIIEDI